MSTELRKKRIESGLTTNEVAKQLNLVPKVLESLENGEIPDHIGDTFARGYLRNYAKLLGVDAEPVITSVFGSCDAESRDESEQCAVSAEDSYKPVQKAKPALRATYLSAGLAAVIMMAVGVWMQEPLFNQDASPALSLTQVEVETPKGKIISRLDEQAANDQAKALELSTGKPDVVDDLFVGPMAAVVSYSADAIEQTSESVLVEGDNDVLVQSGPDGSADLSFAFSDDCWIQVVDGNQSIILSSLAKKNEALQLSGKPPFTVTLGYAPGVSVSYNGEPVKIKVRENRHVAKLVLGNG